MSFVLVLVGLAIAGVGLAAMFYGAKLYKTFLPVLGAAAGFAIGLVIANQLTESHLLIWGSAIVLTIAGWYLARSLWKFGVLLEVASAAFLLVIGFLSWVGLSNFQNPGWIALGAGILFAIFVGMFAYRVQIWHYLLIVITAIHGIALVKFGLLFAIYGRAIYEAQQSGASTDSVINDWVYYGIFAVAVLLAGMGASQQAAHDKDIERMLNAEGSGGSPANNSSM